MSDIRKSIQIVNKLLLTALSSSQQAAQVQEVACGFKICSSMSVCRLLPPNRILRFQSLLDARPQNASNSLGVCQSWPSLMHRPLPPDPNLLLCSSAFVFLHLTGRTAKFADSDQLYTGWVLGVDTCICSDSVSSALFWITMWVAFSSPFQCRGSESLSWRGSHMNPLSTHSICLNCPDPAPSYKENTKFKDICQVCCILYYDFKIFCIIEQNKFFENIKKIFTHT